MKNTLKNLLKPELVADLYTNGRNNILLTFEKILESACHIHTHQDDIGQIIRHNQHVIIFWPDNKNRGFGIKLFYRKELIYQFDSGWSISNIDKETAQVLKEKIIAAIPKIRSRQIVSKSKKSMSEFYEKNHLIMWSKLRTKIYTI